MGVGIACHEEATGDICRFLEKRVNRVTSIPFLYLEQVFERVNPFGNPLLQANY